MKDPNYTKMKLKLQSFITERTVEFKICVKFAMSTFEFCLMRRDLLNMYLMLALKGNE